VGRKQKVPSVGLKGFSAVPAPSPWPGANARLLGVGAGLPVHPLVRLAQFSPDDFERLILEWATDYLPTQVGVDEVQARGGAGDKGRDVLVWLDPSNVTPRRWRLYQCKHYATPLGFNVASVEIAKVLHYTFTGGYTVPEQYWFVTHKGLTNPFQDQIDDPAKLKKAITDNDNWDEYCASKITSTGTIPLTGAFLQHAKDFDFSIFKAKQPLTLIEEYRKTRYYLLVFGAPLLDRPPPPTPPSQVAPAENVYIAQLHEVIGDVLAISVTADADFAHSLPMTRLYNRSRMTFYSAEGLRELARDQMANKAFFDTLLDAFESGLYHSYTNLQIKGLPRLQATVTAAQSLQLGGHVLNDHATPNDREGVCHQLVNTGCIRWCET
jgi:hypothetical protein